MPSSLEATLNKKYGALKAWQWALALSASVALFLLWRRRQAMAEDTPDGTEIVDEFGPPAVLPIDSLPTTGGVGFAGGGGTSTDSPSGTGGAEQGGGGSETEPPSACSPCPPGTFLVDAVSCLCEAPVSCPACPPGEFLIDPVLCACGAPPTPPTITTEVNPKCQKRCTQDCRRECKTEMKGGKRITRCKKHCRPNCKDDCTQVVVTASPAIPFFATAEDGGPGLILGGGRRFAELRGFSGTR